MDRKKVVAYLLATLLTTLVGSPAFSQIEKYKAKFRDDAEKKKLETGDRYQDGIGARLSIYPSATYKRFVEFDKAFEAMLGYRWGPIYASGLFQMHRIF